MQQTDKPVKWEELPKQTPVKFEKPKGNERRRMQLARTALIIGSPFFGILAMRLKIEETPWMPTAGTDGKHCFYNPAYIAGLTDAQVKGLWAHEVMHCANGHIWRMGKERFPDQHKANIAMDYAIDPLIKEAGLDVPNELIYAPWRGYHAERIYALLPEPPKQPSMLGAGGMPGQGGTPGSGDPRTPQYMPIKDMIVQPGAGDSKEQKQGQHTGGDMQQMMSNWKQWTASALTSAKLQGKLPSNLEIMIEDALAPRIPWRDLLRRFVQKNAADDFTWRRPSDRHMARGYYLPRVESEQVPPIKLGWDTSGSHIGPKEQATLAGETTDIILDVKPERLDIYYFDAIVQNKQTFERGDPVLKFKPKGGGGTDFRPVFNAIEEEGEEPACLIMATDCYGSFPDEPPPYPVLWASTVDPTKLGQYYPPFGEVIFIDMEGE